MKSLSEMHSDFMTVANSSFIDLPISAIAPEVPIIVVDKWHLAGDPKTLTKNFLFQSQKQRDDFVIGLLEYETETKHHSAMTIHETTVTVALITKTIEQVTNLDKEYSKFADQLYKDIVYTLER